jgi:hypothetical protein
MPDSSQQQAALRDDVNWVHQPAFDKAYADLTGEPCDHIEWKRETNWNFTADDLSFT